MVDSNYYNNLNVIKILIKYIESNDTSFNDIITFDIIDKVNILIQNDSGDNSIYTEYILELFYDVMIKINEHKKILSNNELDIVEFKKFTKKIEGVAKNFQMCIKLLGSENIVLIKLNTEHSRKMLC